MCDLIKLKIKIWRVITDIKSCIQCRKVLREIIGFYYSCLRDYLYLAVRPESHLK